MVDSIIQISFLKENIMSTAELLIEKGKQEGRQEEMKIIAKKMRTRGFPSLK
jgi:hypothetical protein